MSEIDSQIEEALLGHFRRSVQPRRFVHRRIPAWLSLRLKQARANGRLQCPGRLDSHAMLCQAVSQTLEGADNWLANYGSITIDGTSFFIAEPPTITIESYFAINRFATLLRLEPRVSYSSFTRPGQNMQAAFIPMPQAKAQ